jgi:hypothetical protein
LIWHSRDAKNSEVPYRGDFIDFGLLLRDSGLDDFRKYGNDGFIIRPGLGSDGMWKELMGLDNYRLL